jgi:acyl carrier protein
MGATLCADGGLMTDQEFLQLLNEVAKKAKPFNNELTLIDSMDTRLNETSLDSLDILTCAMHLCEIYDVEEEQSKEMSGETPRDFFDFLKKWGRKQPSFSRTN